jgi:hypothetical protein
MCSKPASAGDCKRSAKMSVESTIAPEIAPAAGPKLNASGRSFMRRREAVEYLASLGLPIAFNTLQKLATTGGGPVFRHFGRWPIYRREDLEDWARSRLSGPKASTSQAA